MSCPSGTNLINGRCYNVCPIGYTRYVDGSCIQDCSKGFTPSNNVCNKPKPSQYKNSGFSTRNQCENISGSTCNTCTINNSTLWYPSCIDGFISINCNTCTVPCPNGDNSSPTSCNRNIIQSSSTTPTSSSTSYIIIVIVIIIILMISLIYHMSVTSVIFGSPIENTDTLGSFEKLYNSRLSDSSNYIYV